MAFNYLQAIKDLKRSEDQKRSDRFITHKCSERRIHKKMKSRKKK